MQPYRKPPPRAISIQICASDNVEARIMTEALQKIATEFNSVELQLMSKKMDSQLNLFLLRGFLTKP